MWRNVLGLVAVAASGSASAQHQLVIDRLNQLSANSPQPDDAALSDIVNMAAKRHAEERQICVPLDVEVKDVASIAGSGGLFPALLSGRIRNAWTVYANHVGCPGTNPVRYMIVQEASGRMQIAPVNEGRSFANPSIMMDAEKQVAVALIAKAQLAKLQLRPSSMKFGPMRVTGQRPRA